MFWWTVSYLIANRKECSLSSDEELKICHYQWWNVEWWSCYSNNFSFLLGEKVLPPPSNLNYSFIQICTLNWTWNPPENISSSCDLEYSSDILIDEVSQHKNVSSSCPAALLCSAEYIITIKLCLCVWYYYICRHIKKCSCNTTSNSCRGIKTSKTSHASMWSMQTKICHSLITELLPITQKYGSNNVRVCVRACPAPALCLQLLVGIVLWRQHGRNLFLLKMSSFGSSAFLSVGVFCIPGVILGVSHYRWTTLWSQWQEAFLWHWRGCGRGSKIIFHSSVVSNSQNLKLEVHTDHGTSSAGHG